MARFAAAWQSVVDRECVLRACFDWVAAPRLVLHARAEADIAVFSPAAVTWPQLLRRDRARGFALHRPGLLRLTVLEAEPGGGAGAAAVRVLLTYHPALLDERGVHLLLREFYRAYAGGGVLPGGERRPDLRDHARWLAGQDTTAARRFWARAAPPPRAAARPGRRHRAERARSAAHPAAGAGDLPAAFLGRAARRRRVQRAAPGVGAAAVPGGSRPGAAAGEFRGAAVGPGHRPAGCRGHSRPAGQPAADDRDRRPGRSAGGPAAPGPRHAAGPGRLPVGQHRDDPRVDRPPARRPRSRPRSCCRLRPRCRFWSGLRCRQHPGAFRRPAPAAEGPAQRTRRPGRPRGHPRSAAGATGGPVTLAARHDSAGGLVLGLLYDRAQLADEDAAALHSQCVRLLRALPGYRQAEASAGQLLDLLAHSAIPRTARPVPPPPHPALTVLRPGHPHADVICLVTAPGVPAGSYDLFVRGHRGPEQIVAVHGTARRACCRPCCTRHPRRAGAWCCAGAGPAGGRPTNSPSARRMLPAPRRPWS
ncbi:hypothetical protein HEP84_52765 [Streptomyces sp. RLB1-33]|nr:hypothetical protein [Streptomyces sp. RLB1-33]